MPAVMIPEKSNRMGGDLFSNIKMRKVLYSHNEATEEEDTLRLDSQLEGTLESITHIESPREFNVEGPISKLASRIFVASGSEETEETSLQTLQEAGGGFGDDLQERFGAYLQDTSHNP